MGFRMYEYKAKLLRVVDGDTIDVQIDLGFHVYHDIRVRLYGINTPESRTRNLKEKALGLKAKRLTQKFCEQSMWLIIKTIKTGKYGRYLSEVYDDKGESLAAKLLGQDLARKYFGTKRLGWFEDEKL